MKQQLALLVEDKAINCSMTEPLSMTPASLLPTDYVVVIVNNFEDLFIFVCRHVIRPAPFRNVKRKRTTDTSPYLYPGETASCLGRNAGLWEYIVSHPLAHSLLLNVDFWARISAFIVQACGPACCCLARVVLSDTRLTG